MIRRRLRLGTVIISVVALAPLLAASSASASVTVTPQQAGMAELMQSYSDGLIGTGWWQAAVAQSTLETYQQATGDTSYYNDIVSTYDDHKGSSPASLPDFENDFTDDTAWWGLAWLQAYNMTGDTAYLQTAEDDANYIHNYWDTDATSCGGVGGVWWEVTKAGRLAISNGLFLQLTAGLHNAISGDTTYLGWAEAEWSWLDGSGIIDASTSLVLNGLNGNCVPAGTIWSYDQGVVVAGLAALYQATGNGTLLTEAEKIATAAIGYLAPDGVLADPCEPSGCDSNAVSFKGIFVRDLKILATIAGTSQYNSFFQAQAASVETRDANADNQFGLVWSGPSPTCPSGLTSSNPCSSDTQASAEDALVAALGPPAARPAAVVGTDGTTRVFALAADGSIQQDARPSGSTAWSGFTSLGGTWPDSPAALAAADGDIWVFATGAGGGLYADTLPSGSATWSGWSDLGSPSMHLIGVPAVVQDTGGAIRVYVRGANGSLYTDAWSGGTWSGFSDLAGTWPYDVAALAGNGGYVHVFAVGTTTALYHGQRGPLGSWSGWSSLGGTVTGVPVAVQDTSGTIRAYARGVSGGALDEFYAASGSTSYSSDSRGGSWPYDAAALAGSGGFVHLFDVGTTASMYWQDRTPGGSWSAWTNLGGTFAGVPAAIQLSNATIVLFAESASGSTEENQLAGGTSTWSGWSSLSSQSS